ncbi:MAG: DUF4147 domain-containing protein [Clostridia bacterium]|nr:DUF4147 domain-containing protein [Clostridia bacterium]
MNSILLSILNSAIAAADPYDGVYRAVGERYKDCGRRISILAIGKAACPMAKGAYDALGGNVRAAFALTKYGHTPADYPEGITVSEAGHPVPDENGIAATKKILEYTDSLTQDDELIFLISGGGSALFEYPLVPLPELRDITNQLLACSAEISEINSVRKRLSAVKGGKFAARTRCPLYQIILSDVVGDRLDSIASGPCALDRTSPRDIRDILNKYDLRLSDEAKELLLAPPPRINEPEHTFVGNVHILCEAAARAAESRGIDATVVTETLCGEAREVGKHIADGALLWRQAHPDRQRLFIYGGETTVTLRGRGKGGRSQELALACADVIAGTGEIYVLAAGSDGTDGPTDAAGGIVSGETKALIEAGGKPLAGYMDDNDAYNALKTADALVFTGPTGTNVNDIVLVLINRK